MISTKYLDMRITSRCQLRCKHCYLQTNHINDTDMELTVFKSIVDNFNAMNHPVNKTELIISGGEAMMHPMFPEFVEYIRSIGQCVRMSTNGICIPTYVDLFERDDGIQVSIDGDRVINDFIRGEGAYDYAVNALKLLSENGIRHSVAMVLCEENFDCINHIAQLCIETNTQSISITPFQPWSHTTMTPTTYEKWIDATKAASNEFSGVEFLPTCIEDGCTSRIMGLTVLPDGTYIDCARNQEVIGKYPRKIEDVMLWDCINADKTINPFKTCCKNIINGVVR